MSTSETNIKDSLERIGWTAIQSFLAIFALGDMGTLRAALVAGGAAALSGLKTIAKKRLES
tara:strand:- start:5255 stop:5437 length:183 start_codon:yes stop_codon:yes gene_type:complete